MAKLVFPSVKAPYRGFAGEVRGWLNRIASYTDRSPDAKAVLADQIKVLSQVGIDLNAPLPATQAVVSDGQVVGEYTISVAAGVVSIAPTA
ncbi:hypothetical protein HOR97_gp43 [Agrobacterium phage Atu_ph03]|uniref:Uncharacterized protein n=2 Tax=Atuphduovirus TaxID=2731928 RepID=A0A2L0UYY9_9CAUD|nr:hypothetical protein HOR96_gp40 [Agrobacterium phage Atu_ph02]YP_009791884.1 hypothetical protein HOR97_gp43 [Agrobacterium phage Atu_ph03]AUZ94749.1 hypothetical protein [Agrobacterium phage Atu_ph02]AUZ94792.1 hypothetical protein [Agrobacterium phage Atu_ph03]